MVHSGGDGIDAPLLEAEGRPTLCFCRAPIAEREGLLWARAVQSEARQYCGSTGVGYAMRIACGC